MFQDYRTKQPLFLCISLCWEVCVGVSYVPQLVEKLLYNLVSKLGKLRRGRYWLSPTSRNLTAPRWSFWNFLNISNWNICNYWLIIRCAAHAAAFLKDWESRFTGRVYILYILINRLLLSISRLTYWHFLYPFAKTEYRLLWQGSDKYLTVYKRNEKEKARWNREEKDMLCAQ